MELCFVTCGSNLRRIERISYRMNISWNHRLHRDSMNGIWRCRNLLTFIIIGFLLSIYKRRHVTIMDSRWLIQKLIMFQMFILAILIDRQIRNNSCSLSFLGRMVCLKEMHLSSWKLIMVVVSFFSVKATYCSILIW